MYIAKFFSNGPYVMHRPGAAQIDIFGCSYVDHIDIMTDLNEIWDSKRFSLQGSVYALKNLDEVQYNNRSEHLRLLYRHEADADEVYPVVVRILHKRWGSAKDMAWKFRVHARHADGGWYAAKRGLEYFYSEAEVYYILGVLAEQGYGFPEWRIMRPDGSEERVISLLSWFWKQFPEPDLRMPQDDH